MRITITLHYHTKWGESVYITGNHPTLGNGDISKSLRMEPMFGSNWSKSFDVDDFDDLAYNFIIKTDDGVVVRREWNEPHKIDIDTDAHAIDVYDGWKDQPEDVIFYSTAFTKGIFNRKKDKQKVKASANEIVLNVYAPMVEPDMVVALTGENDYLGRWDANKALALNCSCYPKWSIAIPRMTDFEYKFVVLNSKTHSLEAWEFGRNRLCDCSANQGAVAVYNNLYLRNPLKLWRGAGTAIPVFSLRSLEDYGVGDFYDLYKLIDWAEASKQRVIQLLPINDTTMSRSWEDSYPYNANSAFALHPMYLRPDAIGELDDKALLKRFKDRAKVLNSLPEVDYVEANKLKEEFAKALYAQLGEKVVSSVPFRAFVKNNSEWLKPYAAYSLLRDEFNTADFRNWGEYSEYESQKIELYLQKNKDAANYVYFVQYFLDKQLREVRNYAHKHNVVLKGDIPIGISPVSVDAWADPRLYNMDCQAGAPPDDFSVLGQNWGFPTYNWEVMRRDGYQWWKRRLAKMEEYFDAYRIDHILGFFRIWQIPTDCVHGLLGTFYPALPLTSEVMRYNYDFWMQRDMYTKPYIHESFLSEYFGEYAEEVKSRFLLKVDDYRYDFQDYVNTQKKVLEYFWQFENDDKNAKIREGLLNAHDDVLFIVDRADSSKYHPRISAQKTHIYSTLTDYEKSCFNRLYEDFFYYRHNDFWQSNALKKLPTITESTRMLVCGEDLGMIPACVANVMNRQKYLSLEIPRMPKEYGVEFGDTLKYPYASVSTTSTHDMSGIRGWWEEDAAKTQRYYNTVLGYDGEAPERATPDICRKMVENCLKSPSVLCILPLQDWMAMDGKIRRANPHEEQINIPSKSRHFWRYRMHINLEELVESRDFCNMVKECVINSAR